MLLRHSHMRVNERGQGKKHKRGTSKFRKYLHNSKKYIHRGHSKHFMCIIQ